MLSKYREQRKHVCLLCLLSRLAHFELCVLAMYVAFTPRETFLVYGSKIDCNVFFTAF